MSKNSWIIYYEQSSSSRSPAIPLIDETVARAPVEFEKKVQERKIEIIINGD